MALTSDESPWFAFTWFTFKLYKVIFPEQHVDLLFSFIYRIFPCPELVNNVLKLTCFNYYRFRNQLIPKDFIKSCKDAVEAMYGSAQTRLLGHVKRAYDLTVKVVLTIVDNS